MMKDTQRAGSGGRRAAPRLLAVAMFALAATTAVAIEGRVADSRGRGREGCAVAAFVVGESRSPEARPVATAVTDEAGRFGMALGASEGWGYDVTIRGCGAATTVRDLQPAASRAPIVVLDSGRLRGRVVDAARRPVIGAKLRLRSTEPNGDLADEVAAETRPDGSFGMSGVPAGVVEVEVRHPGFLDTTTRVMVEPHPRSSQANLVLQRGGRVAGRVERTAVQPDRQALQVELSQEGGPAKRAPVGPTGSFLFERIPPGEVVLTVLAGESPLRTAVAEVREGATTTVDLGVSPIQVSGRVTRNGEPLAGAEVVLAGRGARPFSATTSDDGSYEVLLNEPGRYMARVTAQTRPPLPVRAVEVPEAEWFGLDLEFETTLVEGVVLDASSGKGVGEALIFASPKTPGAPFGDAKADAAGRFRLELLPGEHRLTVQASGFDRQTEDLTVGANRSVRVLLHRGGRLHGVVLGPDGRAVSGVPVSAAGGDPVSSSQWERTATTRSDGSFVIEGLGRGLCDVMAGSDAVGFATLAGVTPGPEPVLLHLAPGGRAQVAVRDETGQPVAGAMGILTAVYGAKATGPILSASDSQGTLLMFTPAGTVSLRVMKGQRWSDVVVEVPTGGVGTAETTLTTPPR